METALLVWKMNRDEMLTNCAAAGLRNSELGQVWKVETQPGSNSLVERMITPQQKKMFLCPKYSDFLRKNEIQIYEPIAFSSFVFHPPLIS